MTTPDANNRLQALTWPDLIRLSTVNLIVGHKGKGKSGLAYFLAETIAPLHGLNTIVVNFPTQKASLLPEGYVIKELEEALLTENAFILVDEGTTELPAGAALEEFVKACSSLSRQRNQIITFIFHASRDVGSRIMRGLDVIMIKEPSKRQIEQGAKDKWFKGLLLEAKKVFVAQRATGGDTLTWCFVDSEEPEFRGPMQNPLPSFWSKELSNAWGQLALEQQNKTRGYLNLSREQAAALTKIEEFESTYAMSQHPNGWAGSDMGVSTEMLQQLLGLDLLLQTEAGGFHTTSWGRTVCLSGPFLYT